MVPTAARALFEKLETPSMARQVHLSGFDHATNYNAVLLLLGVPR